MPAPDDAEAVLAAVRLGWCIAEVRGRNRLDAPASPGGSLPDRIGHALPLQSERTFEEARVAAQAVLIALADKLGVGTAPGGSNYAREVDRKAKALTHLRVGGSPSASVAWDELTGLIYRFDAHIQDSLYAASDTLVCGYQVGRGLAECYWALDPTISGGSSADWSFLFGAERSYELSSLLGRHAAYLYADTAPVIAGSLMVWRQVAADYEWRDRALPHLYRQVRVWHDLTVSNRDPSTYIKPYARLRTSAVAWVTIRSFRGRIALALVGVGALIALIVTLGSGAGTAITTTVLSILAAAGISTAGISAGRFRKDLNTDMTAVAITTAPSPPRGRPNQTIKAVRTRSL